ncbi:MAG TPA: trypsin-like peptidase domain-containing protein [Gemmatimonadaceae bacterium]|nr:trypsin-like peptidase domain-containing protein [Gemmatimonadaceae bacterium]
MSVEFRVLTGSRAGQRERFTKSVIAVGRHPLCDFRFDPQHDLDVSTRHAEIRAAGDGYVLVDIGSTNGTYVNGVRIAREQRLESGDEISFGEFGPRVKVEIEVESGKQRLAPPEGSAALGEAAPNGAWGKGAEDGVSPESAPPATRSIETEARSAAGAATSRRQHGLRRVAPVAAAVVGAILVATVGAYWLGHHNARATDAELVRLTRANDSLAQTYADRMASINSRAAGLDSSLAAAQLERDRMRSALSETKGAHADTLSRELHALESRRHAMLTAAQVDYSTIASRSGPAVTMIAVQWPDSSAFSGSGFAVTSRGEIVTNKHLVQHGDALPMRIAVIFSDTKAWLPAHVVRVSATADLAILQVDAPGPFPAIASLASRAADTPVGKAVAIIGYPLGTDTPMEGSGTQVTARSTLVAGTLSKNLSDVLQIDAYAGQGSSGSPVFNTSGSVIGVVYGGARESAGRIVYAVPVDQVSSLMGRP